MTENKEIMVGDIVYILGDVHCMEGLRVWSIEVQCYNQCNDISTLGGKTCIKELKPSRNIFYKISLSYPGSTSIYKEIYAMGDDKEQYPTVWDVERLYNKIFLPDRITYDKIEYLKSIMDEIRGTADYYTDLYSKLANEISCLSNLNEEVKSEE